MQPAHVFAGRGLTSVRGGRVVFADLSFSIERGAALVVSGANGSGKSTLLRLMAGLHRPVAGSLLWDGEDIGRDRETHGGRLAYVGHLDPVKGAMTPLEQVALWAALAMPASARDSARGRAREALAAFGLAALAEIPARYLSAGQRRRVALARLLAVPVPLWLLDEPFAFLDLQAMGRLEDAIAAHRDRGGMVVLALHGERQPPQAAVLSLPGPGAPLSAAAP